MSDQVDPFERAREDVGVLRCPFAGETVHMLLRHKDVREAAKDWQTYSSDAPFRVPVPSEEHLRSVRQLPIETDPPEHTAYRKLVEPFFKRTSQPEIQARIGDLIDELLTTAIERRSIEVVQDFATVLQSKALTYLLNVPEQEADEWITWGFHSLIDSEGRPTGDRLENYLNRQLDRAYANPGGDDFFSLLARVRMNGRPLSRDEAMGFANLTFAGGRDTVIKTLTAAMAYFAFNKNALAYLREDVKRIPAAGEEIIRHTSPLTHIGRVCPQDTQVHGAQLKSGERISLGWAAANRDPDVFEQPNEIRLDRKPNPHLGFGFGPHNCVGATHARVLVRTLLKKLSERIECLQVLEAQEFVEKTAAYTRTVAYERLVVSLRPMPC
jgi:cytochrome P450